MVYTLNVFLNYRQGDNNEQNQIYPKLHYGARNV